MDAQRLGLNICVLVLLLSIVSCSRVTSDPTTNAVADSRTKVLFDGNVTFSLPDGLEPVALSVVRPGVEPNEGDQTHAFANSGNTVQVIVNLSNIPAKPGDLDEVKRFVEGTHKGYSGWEISEITEINGRRWFHFEWQKPLPTDLVEPPPLDDGAPTPIPMDKRPFHYSEYSTSAGGKLLQFSFSALPEEYPKTKESFSAAMRSINIKN